MECKERGEAVAEKSFLPERVWGPCLCPPMPPDRGSVEEPSPILGSLLSFDPIISN